jgi:N4-gp56 family major capsid protein
MAKTNFTRLTDEELTAWSTELWQAERNQDYLAVFESSGSSSMIQKVTELKKTAKGARAVITLVNDMEGDGVVGDNQLEGNEEELKAYDQSIQIDQLRNANRIQGRMADQKSIVTFREQSRDKLAYWRAERRNELAFLTLSGVAYTFKTDGATRVGSQLPDLEFAADVTAPTTNRYVRWDATTGLVTSSVSNADLVAADTLTWDTIVDLKAYARRKYVRPMRTEGGYDYYNLFVSPEAMKSLKKDADFIAAMHHAAKSGESNVLFKGTSHGGTNGLLIDGVNILEYRNTYSTVGATSGSKWGGGTVDGARLLLCGAQALGYAELGMPTWEEEEFDYGNSVGISVASTFGYKKPVFRSLQSGTDEDFGVVACDVAVAA